MARRRRDGRLQHFFIVTWGAMRLMVCAVLGHRPRKGWVFKKEGTNQRWIVCSRCELFCKPTTPKRKTLVAGMTDGPYR